MALTDEQTSEVFMAIGAATACWEKLESAGVFESTRAKEIGEELCRKIESWITVDRAEYDRMAHEVMRHQTGETYDVGYEHGVLAAKKRQS